MTSPKASSSASPSLMFLYLGFAMFKPEKF